MLSSGPDVDRRKHGAELRLSQYCPGTAKRGIKKAVIKSAACAASLGFAGERQDDGLACGRRGTGRSAAHPRKAVLAADLTTASLIRLLAVPVRV